MTPSAARCRRRFLRYFPGGFRDPTYLDWERGYKAEAHAQWRNSLNAAAFRDLLASKQYGEAVARAVRIEARTNLLFSFEKMALRDAVRAPAGARRMAEGLFEFLHGSVPPAQRFSAWCAVLAALPQRQTRVLTWPLATVFGFIAQPDRHIFLKPNVTRSAAAEYGVAFDYTTRPGWETYRQLLTIARQVRSDLADLQPRDMIDVQSFLWVQGSDEYRGRTFRPVQTRKVRHVA